MAKAGNPRATPAKPGQTDKPPVTARPPTANDVPPNVPKAVRDKLEKLGLRRQLDLALHLPLRYEDETRLTRLTDAVSGETVQLECDVEHTTVQFRPKRTLVCRVRDGDEVRGGFPGREAAVGEVGWLHVERGGGRHAALARRPVARGARGEERGLPSRLSFIRKLLRRGRRGCG